MLWMLFQFPAGLSLLLALGSLGALLAPQFVASWRTRQLAVQSGMLAPLLLVYAVILIRLWLKYGLGWQLPIYVPGESLDLFAALLTTENILLAAVAYVVLIQLAQSSGERWTRRAGYLLVLLTFGWASWEYIGHRAAGVTASDQYAYAQMAVDWVQRGTPLHAFPLFERVFALNLPLFAGVHVGYHLPLGNLRDAPSVWPTGVSFWLALAYGTAGESGLYLVAPIFGLLTLTLMWLFVRRIAHPHAILLAALTVILLATSFEQVNRLLVPMADVPAQFFSWLTIALALNGRALSRGSRGLLIVMGALAGITFGLAYWIRHTQLLLGFAVLLAIFYAWEERGGRERLIFLASFGICALFTALPDLVYHQQVFGRILHVESEELQYFRADALGTALQRLWNDFALGHEFGFVWPLTLLGAVQMARAQFKTFAVLAVWVAALLAFHLPYEALRLRDLLGEFPPLMLWTAWGAVSLLTVTTATTDKQWSKGWAIQASVERSSHPLSRSLNRYLTAIAAILFVLLSLSLRTQTTLARTLSPHRAGFGYLFASEREDFDQLAHLTPPDAVIAVALHSGAIDLYAHRQTVRPNVWTAEDFDRFLVFMQREHRPVYLLYDSPDLRAQLDRLLAAQRLEPIAQFRDLTFFGERDAKAGTLYRVMQ